MISEICGWNIVCNNKSVEKSKFSIRKHEKLPSLHDPDRGCNPPYFIKYLCLKILIILARIVKYLQD